MTHARLLLMTLTLTDLTDSAGPDAAPSFFFFFWLIDAAWTWHLPADFSRFIYSTSPFTGRVHRNIFFGTLGCEEFDSATLPQSPAGINSRQPAAMQGVERPSEHGRSSPALPKMQRVNLIGPQQQQPTDKNQRLVAAYRRPETRGNIAGH